MNSTFDTTGIFTTIDQLSKRVDALEKSNIDWIALYVGVGSLVVSIIAIIVTIILNKINNNKSNITRKEGNLYTIKSNIDAAKLNYQSITMQIASSSDSPELQEMKKDQIDAAQELVFNAYEDACDAFYKNKIIKQDFIDKYDGDIRKYIEAFPNKFSGPIIVYKQMLKYFNEYHLNKKAK